MNIKFLHRNTIITLLLTLLATTANANDWLGRISDDMPVCRLSRLAYAPSTSVQTSPPTHWACRR